MSYYILLGTPFDLEAINQQAQLGQRPRHSIWDLSQQLDATIYQPNTYSVSRKDKIAARLIGRPQHWSMARELCQRLDQNDLVFCTGEGVGFPIALLCQGKSTRPKLIVTVMAPERFRPRNISKVFKLASAIDMFMTNTETKAEFLKQHLRLSREKVYVLPEQTDVKFFTPGDTLRPKTRPLIASAGREQRDYKTLALATQDLDLDVEVCAVSPNASKFTQVSFPEPVPSNMSFYPHDWPEFRQLYRDADVVVVSLLENNYSAGLTSLMEAMACRRPVIITNIPGLARKLIELGVVLGVNPGDAMTMRRLILDLLEHPHKAELMAEKVYDYLLKHHTSEQYVSQLVGKMKKLL